MRITEETRHCLSQEEPEPDPEGGRDKNFSVSRNRQRLCIRRQLLRAFPYFQENILRRLCHVNCQLSLGVRLTVGFPTLLSLGPLKAVFSRTERHYHNNGKHQKPLDRRIKSHGFKIPMQVPPTHVFPTSGRWIHTEYPPTLGYPHPLGIPTPGSTPATTIEGSPHPLEPRLGPQ